MARGVLWLAGGFVATAPAQQLQWRLPPLGAAEFTRQWSAQSDVATSARAARELVPRGAVPERLLPRLPPAPWLCQGELDAQQRSIVDPPRDLRDVVRAVALDLGARGGARFRFDRVPPFGDLAVSGSVTAAGDGGAQELRLRIERASLAAAPAEGREGREAVAAVCAIDLEGTLLVRRVVDAEAGLVREFSAVLDVVLTEGKNAYRRIVLQDAWQLVAVRDNQDTDFRKRVAAAVEHGAAFVRSALQGDGAYLEDKGEDDRSFGSGRIALAAQTLLHAGVPREDPVLTQAFATLRRRKLVDTYSIGAALMALSALHAPAREAELVRSGRLAARATRQLPDADRKEAESWVKRLLQNVDKRTDRAQVLRFNYVDGARFDNSLSQYGLLGMDAAMLCGVAIEPGAFAAAARHFVAVQCPPGGRPLGLQLTSYRQLAAAAGGPPPEPKPVRTAPRGYSYQDADEPAYGGMTVAGITGLLIARAHLDESGADGRLCAEVDRAIEAAFAWLAQEFTVRANPGFVGKSDRHWYYWLYGLERACELAGVAHLQGRDWYYEGALQLLSQQQPNGAFRIDHSASMAIDTTCFAVLFLARGTPAVITGR